MAGAAPERNDAHPVPPRALRLRRHALVVALLGATGVLGLASLWLTEHVIWRHETFFVGLYPARLLVLALAALALFAAFAVRVGWPGHRLLGRRFEVVAFTIALVLVLLEAAFMFVGQTHNVGYTLATRIWWDRHWGPENSLGYRDVEPVRAPDKKLVFLVGDSFTAGAGLARRADRYGDVLAARRPDLQVMNLGHCGDDTVVEFEHLQAHPLRPDVVVLQYYPNDIDGAAVRCGHEPPTPHPYEDIPSVKLRYLVRASFLANFVYWQFPHGDGASYEQFLARMLADERVAAQHHQDLARFCAWAQERHVPLVVVLFPALEDLEWSRKATAGVKQVFAEHGVPVLDVAERIGDLGLDERRVNHHDGHASALVHRRVGEALAELLPH